MILVHKIRLYPTKEQANLFAQACGVARFSYNWGLSEWLRQYAAGEKPNEAALRRQLNAIKGEKYPWMANVSKTVPQQAIKNLGMAFKNTFERIKKGGKPGFPKFKRKGVHESFRADNGSTKDIPNAVKVDGEKVRLPVIGWVRMAEEVRFKGNIKSAVVSKAADQWHVALSVETQDWLSGITNGVVGVDLGVKTLATLSNGEIVEGPKAHKQVLGRIRRLSKSLARKKKRSANRGKAKTKLARLHLRIANIRKDCLHKLTTRLAKEFAVIGIEDLNVKGMVKNHCLARAVSDAGFYEFRRQLEYKAAMTGAKLVVADRWFPSSKQCSNCGAIHEMPLGNRMMLCGCGNKMDRDLNAACNLRNYAASSAVSVCGEEGSDVMHSGDVKPASAKQKLSTEPIWVGLDKS